MFRMFGMQSCTFFFHFFPFPLRAFGPCEKEGLDKISKFLRLYLLRIWIRISRRPAVFSLKGQWWPTPKLPKARLFTALLFCSFRLLGWWLVHLCVVHLYTGWLREARTCQAASWAMNRDSDNSGAKASVPLERAAESSTAASAPHDRGETVADLIEDLSSYESLPGYKKLPCNQCLFYGSKYGCLKGRRCSFCHHPGAPEGNQTARPRRTKREQYKLKVQQLLQMLTVEQGPSRVVDALQSEAQRNRYARTICQGLLSDWLRQRTDAQRHLSTEQGEEAERPTDARPSASSDADEEFCRAWLLFSLWSIQLTLTLYRLHRVQVDTALPSICGIHWLRAFGREKAAALLWRGRSWKMSSGLISNKFLGRVKRFFLKNTIDDPHTGRFSRFRNLGNFGAPDNTIVSFALHDRIPTSKDEGIRRSGITHTQVDGNRRGSEAGWLM